MQVGCKCKWFVLCVLVEVWVQLLAWHSPRCSHVLFMYHLVLNDVWLKCLTAASTLPVCACVWHHFLISQGGFSTQNVQTMSSLNNFVWTSFIWCLWGHQLKYFFSEAFLNSIPSALKLSSFASPYFYMCFNLCKRTQSQKHSNDWKYIHTVRNIGLQHDLELQRVCGGCWECSGS